MIGIITDSHEHEEALKVVVPILKDRKPEIVVHCGDIVSPPVLEWFKDLPMIIVFGNNDGEIEGLKAKCNEYGWTEIDFEQEFEHDGKKFFVCHGHRKGILREAIESQKYDVILTGHTHVLRDEKIGKTRIINVGCLFKPLGGQNCYSFGFLDGANLELVKLDLDTLEVLR